MFTRLFNVFVGSLPAGAGYGNCTICTCSNWNEECPSATKTRKTMCSHKLFSPLPPSGRSTGVRRWGRSPRQSNALFFFNNKHLWQDLKLWQTSQQEEFFDAWEALKSVFGQGSALNHAEGAFHAPSDLLVGWGGGSPSPFLTSDLDTFSISASAPQTPLSTQPFPPAVPSVFAPDCHLHTISLMYAVQSDNNAKYCWTFYYFITHVITDTFEINYIHLALYIQWNANQTRTRTRTLTVREREHKLLTNTDRNVVRFRPLVSEI